jgi:hypothetical protein
MAEMLAEFATGESAILVMLLSSVLMFLEILEADLACLTRLDGPNAARCSVPFSLSGLLLVRIKALQQAEGKCGSQAIGPKLLGNDLKLSGG